MSSLAINVRPGPRLSILAQYTVILHTHYANIGVHNNSLFIETRAAEGKGGFPDSEHLRFVAHVKLDSAQKLGELLTWINEIMRHLFLRLPINNDNWCRVPDNARRSLGSVNNRCRIVTSVIYVIVNAN